MLRTTGQVEDWVGHSAGQLETHRSAVIGPSRVTLIE
jgi:hypothetical protein